MPAAGFAPAQDSPAEPDREIIQLSTLQLTTKDQSEGHELCCKFLPLEDTKEEIYGQVDSQEGLARLGQCTDRCASRALGPPNTLKLLLRSNGWSREADRFKLEGL